MFLEFPVLLPQLSFWSALVFCTVITVICFGLFALTLRRFDIELLQTLANYFAYADQSPRTGLVTAQFIVPDHFTAVRKVRYG